MDGREAIVIASAARTPVGSFNETLSTVPADDLGKVVITEALVRANVDRGEVSEFITGQILANQGQNPARQAAINASLPIETTAISINFLCGSGLRSITMAAQAIRLSDNDLGGSRRPGKHVARAELPIFAQGARLGHFEMHRHVRRAQLRSRACRHCLMAVT